MDLVELLKIVVCPECKQQLTHVVANTREGLSCANCGVIYPIVENIPVLLTEKAIRQGEWICEC